MLEFIWWLKTVALFDVWTFEHILSWLSVWHAVRKKNHEIYKEKLNIEPQSVKTKYFDLLWVLFLAYAWETLEHYLETWLAWEAVEYWFQGVEMWWNRLITDPLMLVLWYMIAKKYPSLVMPARVLSIILLFVHIFIFPHSMYLHELL